MTTLHPRLNITIDQHSAAILAELAKQNHQSTSAMAKELILEALERREDLALSAIAKKRDSSSKKRIKHKDVWK